MSGRKSIIDHIDFRDAVSISDFYAGDISIIDERIGEMTADIQHGLYLRNIDNIGIICKHYLV